jgi:hypothetical protein
MNEIFGITGQRATALPSAQLEENWCALSGFDDTYQTERYFFFATGDQVFKKEMDVPAFFQAFEKSPEHALTKLPGLSCGAIWDAVSRELIVYTDSFSVFPIYYAHDAYKALFAGSLRKLVNSGEVEIQLDATAVIDYFRFSRFLPAKTLFTGIAQLEPGQYLRIHEDYFQTGFYWDWSRRKYTEFRSVEQIVTTIDGLAVHPNQESDFALPNSPESLSNWVSQLDFPVDAPWSDPNLAGAAETLGANEVFDSLVSLMKKKWPMSFPVFLRSYLSKTGLWKWPGLTGRWRKERMVQEYWDLEFLYQFEELNWSDERIQSFFDWSAYPKNGLFLYLNERIGYGKPGFSFPPTGRVSFAEWHFKILGRYLPLWRAVHDEQLKNKTLPFFNRDWVSYAMSVPDGLKESAHADSLAQRYMIDSTKEIRFNLPLPSEEEWKLIEKGLSRLPLVRLGRLMETLRKQPECFHGIIILGLWLATQIQYETR